MRRTGVPFSGGAPVSAVPTLPLHIDAVFEHHAQLPSRPWHQPGGDWTFLALSLADGTRFLVGIRYESRPSAPMRYGSGVLIVDDAAHGARLAAAYAHAFGVDSPAPGRAGEPRPLALSFVELQRNAQRLSDGSFVDAPGSWVSTKWEIAGPEVYFNFDLHASQAELSEKRSSGDAQIARNLMLGLHDGVEPQPEE